MNYVWGSEAGEGDLPFFQLMGTVKWLYVVFDWLRATSKQ